MKKIKDLPVALGLPLTIQGLTVLKVSSICSECSRFDVPRYNRPLNNIRINTNTKDLFLSAPIGTQIFALRPLLGRFVFFLRKFSKSIQENLFRGPGDLSDLVSINIQRSRERGVPSYVTYRNSGVCNLKANINSFEDLEKIGFSKEDIQNLKKVYEDVKDVDLFTGGIIVVLKQFI